MTTARSFVAWVSFASCTSSATHQWMYATHGPLPIANLFYTTPIHVTFRQKFVYGAVLKPSWDSDAKMEKALFT
jgi:hypothetical protein